MVAADAITALARLTGRVVKAAPRPLPRPAVPTLEELEELRVAHVELEVGGSFDIRFDREHATLAYARFARLVRAGYFDGLTFHRVAPNFVIQGGSPGANEYAGDAIYMSDELGDTPHAVGTVGISTRGRDTGDAQLFVNLVENRRLEFEYTVIGTIVNPTRRAGAGRDHGRRPHQDDQDGPAAKVRHWTRDAGLGTRDAGFGIRDAGWGFGTGDFLCEHDC